MATHFGPSVATCVCGFIAAPNISPTSPTWHRQHRDAHLKRYPKADQRTRESLDELISAAERVRVVKAAGSLRGLEVGDTIGVGAETFTVVRVLAPHQYIVRDEAGELDAIEGPDGRGRYAIMIPTVPLAGMVPS